MRRILSYAAMCAIMLLGSCTGSAPAPAPGHAAAMHALADTLAAIAASYPGQIGVALITHAGDTITVNNHARYPLMSVFKLHQAIALCDHLGRSGTSLDTVVTIDTATLNPATWSPMLKEHTGSTIKLPVSELLRYALIQSDNNASNYLFDHFLSVQATDSAIATMVPRDDFRLAVTEDSMWHNHDLAAENRSSPLAAASLIHRLFTDTTVCPYGREFLCRTLAECRTGADRIAAPLACIDSVTVAHKTGSGFVNDRGILGAHNDVAFITLPGGRHYALAVLIKDFHGPDTLASRAISRLSLATHTALSPR